MTVSYFHNDVYLTIHVMLQNILILPTVPSPRPAYFIHQGTSSLATGSCPGLCIIDDIFSAND